MSDQVGNPEDRFSHDAAQVSFITIACAISSIQCHTMGGIHEQRHEKTSLREFQPGLTQPEYSTVQSQKMARGWKFRI